MFTLNKLYVRLLLKGTNVQQKNTRKAKFTQAVINLGSIHIMP